MLDRGTNPSINSCWGFVFVGINVANARACNHRTLYTVERGNNTIVKLAFETSSELHVQQTLDLLCCSFILTQIRSFVMELVHLVLASRNKPDLRLESDCLNIFQMS
jgi:hypothetical protein